MKLLRKIILTLFIFGVGYFLISYSTENKKYQILNEIFTDINFNPKKICVIKNGVDFNKLVFSELEFYDKPSAIFQYIIQNAKTNLEIDNKILENKINNSKIINDCSAEMQKIRIDEKTEKWETDENAQISLPILSIDKKTAIIQITNNCGMLCGNTTLYAFKKIEGKWKIINKKMLKIS